MDRRHEKKINTKNIYIYMEKKIGIEILYYFLACNHSIHNGFPLRKRSFSETRALINDLTTAVDRAEGRYAIEKRNFTKRRRHRVRRRRRRRWTFTARSLNPTLVPSSRRS